MLKQEYMNRLTESCFIDIYLAGVDGARIDWPWRMAKTNGSLGHRYRNACETYWVDSNIQNDEYTNIDVLNDAYKYNADSVLLADVMHDYDATIESINKGLDMADDHAFDGEIIIPLQEPYVECYEQFKGESEYFAIGGLANEQSDPVRIKAAKSLRNVVGNETKLHGLGWGLRDGLVAAIQTNPDLLDSVDCSSPVQTMIDVNGSDERMSVQAAHAGAKLVQWLRSVTPYAQEDSDPQKLRGKGQSGIEAYQ